MKERKGRRDRRLGKGMAGGRRERWKGGRTKQKGKKSGKNDALRITNVI